MTRLVGRAGTAGVALALGTVLVGTTFGPWDGPGRDADRSTDLTATALTAPGHPAAVDDAVRDGRAGPGRAKVGTTSSAAADCDGCSADASALHVVYLDRPTEAVLENVGVAWSQCTGCRSTSLSVQVVVLRSPGPVRADNRALAVNAACDTCRTTAVAYQLVVVGDRSSRLSRSARQELEQWVVGVAAGLRDPTGVAPSALRTDSGAGALDQLEQLVDTGLGGAQTLQRDADVETGAPPPAPSETVVDPAA